MIYSLKEPNDKTWENYVFEQISWKKLKKKVNEKLKQNRRHSRQKDMNSQIDMWSKINKDQKTQIYSEEYFRNIKERRWEGWEGRGAIKQQTLFWIEGNTTLGLGLDVVGNRRIDTE